MRYIIFFIFSLNVFAAKNYIVDNTKSKIYATASICQAENPNKICYEFDTDTQDINVLSIQNGSLSIDSSLVAAKMLKDQKEADKKAKYEASVEWLKNLDIDNLSPSDTKKLYKNLIRVIGIMNTLDNQ